MNAEDYQGESVYREPEEPPPCYSCGCLPCTCDEDHPADDYGNFYGEDFEP